MIHIVDYGLGNLGSIGNMLKKIAVPCALVSDPAAAREARKLILPGVGSFDHGMASLVERGWLPVLDELVRERRLPVLGICLGMQLMTRSSEEGARPGLGWIDATTVRFPTGTSDASGARLRVPHMGWNRIDAARAHPLVAAEAPQRYYFVHSYHVVCDRPEDVIATSEYGHRFACAFARDNVMGVQFHPEKSHAFGMRLLRAFADLP